MDAAGDVQVEGSGQTRPESWVIVRRSADTQTFAGRLSARRQRIQQQVSASARSVVRGPEPRAYFIVKIGDVSDLKMVLPDARRRMRDLFEPR